MPEIISDILHFNEEDLIYGLHGHESRAIIGGWIWYRMYAYSQSAVSDGDWLFTDSCSPWS